MYIVRDVFHLKFGQYRPAKALIDEAKQKNMFPEAKSMRVLTDFTGKSYRLIMEEGFDSLQEYEKNLGAGLNEADWKSWYERFIPLVETSYREILKQVL